MKKSMIIISLFACLFAVNSKAESTHKANFFDTIQPAHSVGIIKVVSGEVCVKDSGCKNFSQKKYKFVQVKKISGQDVVVNSVVSAERLCIDCEYFASFYVKRDKSIVTSVFPINIVTHTKTKERRLLYGNEDLFIPFELVQLHSDSICNSNLKCKSQVIYRYVSEKVFTDFLLKFR